MDIEKLIRKYLAQSYMMSLATVNGDKPWVATVYYVMDEDMNLYWASPEDTNHSQHIIENQNVAIAIPVVHKKSQPVVGIQIEGVANQVKGSEDIKPIAEKYAASYGFSEKWVEKFSLDQTKHKLYKFSPKKFVLFDDIDFPDNPRQTWTP
ncbi:MAG TPA: pyridoxamine 5'-phosphate oxidase family protein [Candidatus Saccharibacteria bacterium]|nr:pyridoxamine 5'-phosphate oxidase family protein [Candidatus Saccharibacteria bacterium]